MVRVADVVLLALSPASALVVHDAGNWLPLKGIRNHDRWAFSNVELDDYLHMGFPKLKRLKKKFANSTVIGHLVNETCGPPQPDIDLDGSWNCDWQELDTLLCETTLKAGRMGMLGDVDVFKALMINETADLEWAEAMGPAWLGAYRMQERVGPGATPFDLMVGDLKTNAETYFGSDTMQGLHDICVTAKTANTTCRASTLQHIVCQKAEQAALKLFNVSTQLLPMLEKATEQSGNADQVLRSGDALRTRSEEMFRSAASLTQQSWMNTGPNSSYQLKRRFLDTKGVYKLLDEMCQNNEEADCHWKYADQLLCHMLQRFEPEDPTGEVVDGIEAYIRKNLKSDGTDGNHGFDWGFRTGMIAKWRLNMADMPTGGPMGELKEKVIKSDDFKMMMPGMCEDMKYNRPGCYQSAQQSLFCLNLVQATAEVAKDNVEKFLTWVKLQVPCFGVDFPKAYGAAFLRPFTYDPDPCEPGGAKAINA